MRSSFSLLIYPCAFIVWTVLTASPVGALQIQETFRSMLEQRLEQTRMDDSIVQATDQSSSSLPQLTNGLEYEPHETNRDAISNASTSTTSLEQFEAMAIANHPRLKQLQLEISALNAESMQVALPPNPRVGVFGDELFNDDQGGLYGAYLNETYVPKAKLQSRANVKCLEADSVSAQIQVVEQRIRTDVRTAFYRVLIAQRQNKLATNLAESYRSAIDQMQSLFQAGEITRSAILQVEVQFQQAINSQNDSQAAFMSAWRQLAAVTGDMTLTAQNVEGDLDLLAEQMDFNIVLADVIQRSPELQLAVAQIRQAEAVVRREKNAALPETQAQWTLGRDSATEDVFAGFQLSVPWQRFNRNQGNISAAESRLQAAHLESELLARQLANRLASEFQAYEAARNRALVYVNEVLPKAQEAVEMVNRAFAGGEAGFLDLLTSQRTLIESTNQFLSALQNLWISRQKIEGLLLSGSFEGDNR